MKFSTLLVTALALCATLPAQAQRQLLCDQGQQCSITCYQDGMENSDEVFHREKVDALQLDLNARVLKIEFRGQDQPPRAYDYFILGSEMSCAIENMHGVHD